MPRKIKVFDITPENNEKDPVNDEVEVVKELEPIVEEEVKQEEEVEETPQEIPQDIPQETPTEIVEEVTKTRKQELKQCPKCKKWLTAKTLFYFHECTKNDVPKAKRRPKKVIVKDIEDTSDYEVVKTTSENIEPHTPKLPKQIDYTPKIEISYEDMRRERIKQRIEQRSVKIKNLFSSAI